MQAFQIQENLIFNNGKSSVCFCENVNIKNSGKKVKCYNLCELCSEKKFLRQVSNPACYLNDPFME